MTVDGVEAVELVANVCQVSNERFRLRSQSARAERK
jgi:hypothetical protein